MLVNDPLYILKFPKHITNTWSTSIDECLDM